MRLFSKLKTISSTKKSSSIVSAYNEWDLLEEVIVGIIEGATVPEWHVQLESTVPENQKEFYKKNGGKPFLKEQIDAAKRDLDEFVHILESEGVTVKRPEPIDFCKPYSTLDWTCKGGLYAATPRDILLVIGEEIIEAPMAWRSRYHEINAFRPLIKDYFKKGAKWTSVPKPQMSDELYNKDYGKNCKEGECEYSITEFEPVFDAADFMRFGRDIFAQKSNVTNQFGLDWLQQHLGDEYKIHVLNVNDDHPMHIDATLMPLAPGKLLVNKERIGKIPDMFKGWDIIEAPNPCIPNSHCLYMTSKWINMNLISLDEKRVMVEKSDEPMIKLLKHYGFEPILCNFRNFNTFGGSFHCATVDIRRKGDLKSYF